MAKYKGYYHRNSLEKVITTKRSTYYTFREAVKSIISEIKESTKSLHEYKR